MHKVLKPAILLAKPPKPSTSTSTPSSSQKPPAAIINSLDHIVLTVASIPKAQEWYARNLGMRPESFVSASSPEITRHSLLFGQMKINLHELGKVP